jgi:transposase
VPFLRIENKPSGQYLRILESYRKPDGKSTHRTLYSIGRVDDYTPEQLRSMGVKLFELGGGEVNTLLQGEIREKARYNYGYALVYSKVLKYYGLHNLIARIQRGGKIKFDLYNAVLLMLLERLHDPCSKRSNWFHQEEYLGVAPLELQHIYRALDKLAANSKLIQRQIFQTGRDMFNQQMDVVFYDVTTLYFESEAETEGNLRQKGFGKDGKIGNTQVLFCMLIDKNKNPVGYHIFKGNTFEGHTLEHALKDLKKEYQIDKIIVVADRGMLSKKNILLIEDEGYEFIIGERIRNLPKAIQDPLLKVKDYKHEWIYTDNKNEKIHIKYTTIEYEGKTIIATYSDKRAQKDKHDREEKLETARKLLDEPHLLNKKASRFYLKAETTGKYVLNEDKIKADEVYDGILAIATNNATLSHTEILEQYKQLFKIEQSFRTFKTHLETRPMFHWTNTRIEGHICLCYIAFTLNNFILQKAVAQKLLISEMQLRELLDKMQLSLVEVNEKEVYLRSKPTANETSLLSMLGLKPLPPLAEKSTLAL